MKKPALTIFMMFLYIFSFGQENIVQFKISKPYNILNFVETANGQRIRSSTLKNYVEANLPKNDTTFTRLLNRFQDLNLNYAYKQEEFPANRNQYRSTYDLLCIAAVQSNSIPEFKQRTVGILPNSEHQKLFRVLTHAEKYYDQIIWKPYHSKIQNQLNALEKYQPASNALFKAYRNFYNSSWTNDIPFTVALYPIPGKKGNSAATPHANSLCVGVLTDETEYVQRIGVVLHEICHVLYSEQVSTFQHKLDSAFMQSKSPYNKLAYSFFDEALATALGNGFTYQYITNKPDTSAWYNNTYINGFAHAIYPIISQYVEENRRIDNAFVQKAINLFGETFPKSPKDYGIIMNNVFMYTDYETSQERSRFNSMIGNYFRLSHSNFSSPILHEYSLESLKNTKETQLIIIDRNYEKNIAKLIEVFPTITNYLKGKKQDNYILSFFDASRRPIVIIRADNFEALNQAFTVMNKQQYINESTPYVPIK